MGSAQSRWVLKFGPIVPRKLGANGSLLTRRWREVDSNLRSPVSGDTPQRPLITSPAIIFRESSACASPQRLRPFRGNPPSRAGPSSN